MDWVTRVEQLRRWSRNGERAPHKPLLLLYALGRYQVHGAAPIRFADAESRLELLLREFGPPRKTSPGYPFHHLTSDGLWEVRTADGAQSPGSNVGDLRRQDASGRLAPELVAALDGDSHLLAQLARAVLDTNFEPSLHADICALAGLDLETAETRGLLQPTAARHRSPDFRREVLIAYEYQCAFCGYDGMLGGVPVALDAAHVRWWSHQGPDTVDNGICLCSLHHKLFDKGVMGMSGQRTIMVSRNFVGRSASARNHVMALADKPVIPPQAGSPVPDDTHLTWHFHQVFRRPARGEPSLSP